MLQAALKEKVIVQEKSLKDYVRRRQKEEKVKNWKDKALNGVFGAFVCSFRLWSCNRWDVDNFFVNHNIWNWSYAYIFSMIRMDDLESMFLMHLVDVTLP